MEKFLVGLGGLILVVALIFVFGLIGGVIVMWLWNWLVPTLFGLSTITYWQGWGLCVLCEMLFGSSTSAATKS